MFSSQDKFYESGGGRTIGVLFTNSNKLAQEIVNEQKQKRVPNVPH